MSEPSEKELRVSDSTRDEVIADNDAPIRTNIREELQKNGTLIYPIRGISMLPMLRQDSDCVVLEKTSFRDLKPMDIVLYFNPQRDTYILHRLLWKDESFAMILGDNCVGIEKVPEEWVLGRLTSFFRGEKEVATSSVPYRLYVFFWAKPWKLRILLLKLKNKAFRAAGRAKRLIFRK